jgi:repressor LexA
MLTPRQQQVVDFLRHYQAEHRMPPTQAEIAAEFGFTQKAAGLHLHAIARKGVLEVRRDIPRGIRLADAYRPANDEAYLPLVGRVAAGPPVLAADEVDELVPIAPSMFHPRADFLRRVVGDSMIDMGIQNGDLIGVKQTPEAENGQVVVAKIFQREGITLTVKRYKRSGNTIYLIPRNEQLKTLVIELEAFDEADQREPQFEIEGLYCGHFHPHR